MLKIARIAIKKNAAFSDYIVVFGVKPYIVAFTYVDQLKLILPTGIVYFFTPLLVFLSFQSLHRNLSRDNIAVVCRCIPNSRI